MSLQQLTGADKFGGKPWHGRVLRYAMLATHYRQPIDWTVERLTQARSTLAELSDLLAGVTAETMGHSLLTQFDGLEFRAVTLPFVSSLDKAEEAVRKINLAAEETGVKPIIFGTLVQDEVREVYYHALLCGFVGQYYYENGDTGEVSIYLTPGAHGRDNGGALLRAQEEWVRCLRTPVTRLIAVVLGENDASHRLFARNGYTRLPTHYEKRITR
mgnify:CR=1 FL=1